MTMARLVGVTLFPEWHNMLERSHIQQHRHHNADHHIGTETVAT